MTPSITGHHDGYAIRFGGEVAATFPTLDAARDAMRAMTRATERLAELFGSTPLAAE